MRFQGVFVAQVTPFTTDGGVDFRGLEQHLDFLAEAGVHGFVPCGTTGESPTLESDEWAKIIALTVKKATAKKLPVIAGCGSNSTAIVNRKTKEASQLGADAALVVTPYYNKPTPAGVTAHYLDIADKSPIPIILYHVPGRTNVTLSIETIQTLFRHPNIVGIKEASGQFSLWQQIATRCNLAEKALLAGDDDAFAAVCALGGTGIISAAANVAPHLYVELSRLIQSENWKSAHQLQGRLLPLVRSLFAETNPAPIKFALSRLRGLSNTLRLPLVPISSNTESMVLDALRGLELQPC